MSNSSTASPRNSSRSLSCTAEPVNAMSSPRAARSSGTAELCVRARSSRVWVTKFVTEPLHQSFIFTADHGFRSCRAAARLAYFGALNCVAPSFFASSMPVLQVACTPLGMSEHLVKSVTASSKCEVFSLQMPSR